MSNFEVTIKVSDGVAFCNVTEQRTREVTVIADGVSEQRIEPLGPHSSSVSLGDFAVLDEVDVIDPATGKVIGTRSVPRLDEKTGKPVYRDDDYKAALVGKIEPLMGKGASDIIAAVALDAAKVDAVRQEVVALVDDAKAREQAAIVLAAQAAADLALAKDERAQAAADAAPVTEPPIRVAPES